MPLFYTHQPDLAPGATVHLRGQDAWHISRALRCRPGEVITVVAEEGVEHEVRLDTLEPDAVAGTVVASRRARREPRARIHVVQALPKGPGMAACCEQLTEVGAAGIWPVLTRNTVARPEAAAAARRLERWRAVTREAAQLARRHRVPPVAELRPLADTLRHLRDREPTLQMFVCHEGEQRQSLASAPFERDQPCAVCIGPEGGFLLEEVQELVALGARPVTLGPRVLRTTLAGVVAVTALLARSGDLEAPAG